MKTMKTNKFWTIQHPPRIGRPMLLGGVHKNEKFFEKNLMRFPHCKLIDTHSQIFLRRSLNRNLYGRYPKDSKFWVWGTSSWPKKLWEPKFQLSSFHRDWASVQTNFCNGNGEWQTKSRAELFLSLKFISKKKTCKSQKSIFIFLVIFHNWQVKIAIKHSLASRRAAADLNIFGFGLCLYVWH
jgi:hypothetical protein